MSESESEQERGQEQKPERVEVQLFSEHYRNEQFESNMAFFRDFHPGLFQAMEGYQPQEYRLCLNPDGSPNIFNMKEKNLLLMCSIPALPLISKRFRQLSI